MVCVPFPFTQSAERRDSRWEGPTTGESFSPTSPLKAVNECGFRCHKCKTILPLLPPLAAFIREEQTHSAHVTLHRLVVAGREPQLINRRNLFCVPGLGGKKKKREEDGCRLVLSAQAACRSDLLC